MTKGEQESLDGEKIGTGERIFIKEKNFKLNEF